jgi:hypothetical protein
MTDTAKNALIFLLKEYVEQTSLKMQEYIDTAEAFKDETAIAEEMRAGVEGLHQKMNEAERLLNELR